MALDLNDKTANGNNLTNAGAAEWITDFPFAASTEAIALVASESDSLSANDSASLSITGDITIELWVKPDSLPASNASYILVAKNEDTAGDGQKSYQFYFFNNAGTHTIRFLVSNDGSAQEILTLNHTPTTGTWAHYAVVFTASTSTAEFFKDGTSLGTNAGTFTAIFNSTAKLVIGARRSGALADFYDGKMDEIRIWNTTRTSTQISDNRSIELVGNESGLAAYWPFESLEVLNARRSLLGVGL